MPAKKPLKTTDRRRTGKVKTPSPTLEQVNAMYEQAAQAPWTRLFNDRRG
jgi:hypothetical protein